MTTGPARALLRRLGQFLDGFSACFSRRPQREAASQYLDGLLNDSERKSMQAMHGRLSDPGQYQALQHFITHSPWDAQRVWTHLRTVVPVRTGILAIDDTGFPKQGTQSVGVQRQYCGALGKIGNCQVAVSSALIADGRTWPLAFDLYLPVSWTEDADRRTAVGLPPTVQFREKWRIALAQVRAIRDAGFDSPDGAWIGFHTIDKIKKVPAAGGASAVVCDLSPGMRGPGASWGDDDAIYFSGNDGIFKVSAAGGTPVRIAEPVRSTGERLLLPQVLPGGKAVLFTTVVSDLWDTAKVVVQPLDAGTQADTARRDLITGGADARHVASGHLVYMKSGTLMAAPFDAASQQMAGAPVALIDNVMQAVNAPNFDAETGAGQFAVSASGTLLYAAGGIGPIRQSSLVWVDRSGAVTPLPVVPPAPQLQPRLSPDGRKIALDIRRGASRVTDVWVFDVARGAPTRVTLAMPSHGAVWSPDSRRLAFVASAGGVGNKVFAANADGSGRPERLTDLPGNQTASRWAANGSALAFMSRAPDGPPGIWVLPMSGTPRTPKTFLESGVNLSDPELSPDGTWMAYVSYESGPPEVYVQPYPGPGEKIRISTNVGYEPIWTRNGREILYRSSTPDGEHYFYSVVIRSLSPLQFDPPRLLFKTKAGTFDSTYPIRGWDATADGQRFLMNQPIPSTDKPVTEVHVVLNWIDELRRRVPTR